jgi:hypothetical protein
MNNLPPPARVLVGLLVLAGTALGSMLIMLGRKSDGQKPPEPPK